MVTSGDKFSGKFLKAVVVYSQCFSVMVDDCQTVCN